MKRPEGHNLRKLTSKNCMKDENNNITITKPEKLEGLDQQKLEGSEVQKIRNITNKHEHDKKECTKNEQRRKRQKQNKQNFMNKYYIHDDSKCRHKNNKIRVGEGATQGCDRRRPLPRLREKARSQGNWVKREQDKPQRNNYHKHKLARVWTGTPPSGEPGEPRWHIAKLRTPSPKPEVEKKRDITIIDKSNKRNRNYKRGIRSEVAINNRKNKVSH